MPWFWPFFLAGAAKQMIHRDLLCAEIGQRFEEKMELLANELPQQFEDSRKLETSIEKNLEAVCYGN